MEVWLVYWFELFDKIFIDSLIKYDLYLCNFFIGFFIIIWNLGSRYIFIVIKDGLGVFLNISLVVLNIVGRNLKCYNFVKDNGNIK